MPRSREAFLKVLESAWTVVLRLEAAAAAKRAELDRERSALLEDWERLEAAHKPFDARVRAACSAHE
ncbi:hypothetical protein E2562_009630 [Oryza meyeriana var. granulata]|uniref:Uncharacterized protein n=1 Tax=Oryza meyeriana var. granulata TaxID=110450 RepID=A0A6G1BJ72_9ORYZ|nr:hypothetical protein E2562_009630 [Oryza meyeriana var. granulata]